VKLTGSFKLGALKPALQSAKEAKHEELHRLKNSYICIPYLHLENFTMNYEKI